MPANNKNRLQHKLHPDFDKMIESAMVLQKCLNIKCKKELPLNDDLKNLQIKWDDVQFQTKDLDNCLSEYIISENGELLEEIVEREYIYYTEEEKKQKRDKWSFYKDVIEKNRYTKKVEYHGKITFYELFDISETEDIWVDFDAYFTYGKLDRIELVKTEKQESRKIRMDKFWEEQKKKTTSISYRIRKYSGWFWFWDKVGKISYNISRFFGNIHMFIVKYNR
jgi:hypothetical protein